MLSNFAVKVGRIDNSTDARFCCFSSRCNVRTYFYSRKKWNVRFLSCLLACFIITSCAARWKSSSFKIMTRNIKHFVNRVVFSIWFKRIKMLYLFYSCLKYICIFRTTWSGMQIFFVARHRLSKVSWARHALIFTWPFEDADGTHHITVPQIYVYVFLVFIYSKSLRPTCIL